MKLLFKTDFVSNEYWNGTDYVVVNVDPRNARKIMELRDRAVTYLPLMTEVAGCPALTGNIRIPCKLPGRFFADPQLTNNRDLTELFENANEGKYVAVVPEDFDPSAINESPHLEYAKVDSIFLQFDADGEIWIVAYAKHSGDYIEVGLPVHLIAQIAEMKT